MPEGNEKNREEESSPGLEEQGGALETVMSFKYSAPLPPAPALAQYNNVIPDGAERIMIMAEKQADHRRKLEANLVRVGSRDSLLGLIFGFFIGLSGIAGSVICISNGYTVGGSIIGTGTLGGLVSVFVYGSRQRRSEEQNEST